MKRTDGGKLRPRIGHGFSGRSPWSGAERSFDHRGGKSAGTMAEMAAPRQPACAD